MSLLLLALIAKNNGGKLVMIFNLEFSNEQCEELLSKLDYKVETVPLYYELSIDPYGKENDLVNSDFKIAYPSKDKPQKLCEEHPLLEECKEYLYHTVVQKILNQQFFKLLTNNMI